MNVTHPLRHFVRIGVPVVVVEDEDGRYYGRRDHEHNAVEIRPQERHGVGGGRHGLCNHVEEHGEREENGHSERQLFSGIWGQGESQHGHGSDQDARDYQVEEVVEGAASYYDDESDVYVGLRAAVVVDFIPLSRNA